MGCLGMKLLMNHLHLKIRFKSLLLLSFFWNFCALAQETKSLKEAFLFLNGTWMYTSYDTLIIENWEYQTNKWIGYCITKKGADTVFQEQLTIESINDTIYYTPIFKGETEIVRFKLKQLKNQNALFENKKNDFPKIIGYQRDQITGNLIIQLSNKKEKTIIIYTRI